MDKISIWRLAGITFLAWLSVLGFDFLLHASILGPFYANPSPFLLPPERAFVLIPVGYLSFLIFMILVVWLMLRLNITSWQAGLFFGLKLGTLVWGTLTISLISISTAPILLMVGWFFGQTIETGLAGLVVGAGLGAEKLWSILIKVLLFVFGSFLLGIVLQNI